MASDDPQGSMTPEPRIRGIAFRSMLASLRRLKGESVFSKVVDSLPEELARTARHDRFIVGSWYPLSDYADFLHTAERVAAAGPELARTLGHASVMQDFRGIYRVLTAVLSPQFLLKRASAFFNRYYDTGTLHIPEAGAGYMLAHYRGCRGFDRTLWMDVIGGSAGLLEACGAEQVVVDIVAGGGNGDEHCSVRGKWR